MRPAQFAHQGKQHRRRDAQIEAEPDDAFQGHAGKLPSQAFRQFYYLFGRDQQRIAIVGQFYLVVVSFYQDASGQLFQTPHLSAHGLLRQAHALSHTGKCTFLAQVDEHAHQCRVDESVIQIRLRGEK
jgi:hypothetical protein